MHPRQPARERIMKIWIARHGQTRLNAERRLQGRVDEPLSEHGIEQARAMRAKYGDVTFDAVYASPLKRAVKTAEILGNTDCEHITIEPRVIEVDFGKYELRSYAEMGIPLSLHWILPEVFPAPATVESIASMKERSVSFLKELEALEEERERNGEKPWENVLVACHGGIMRTLTGYLDDRRTGLWWRPKPHNCETRVFETNHGKHTLIADYKL